MTDENNNDCYVVDVDDFYVALILDVKDPEKDVPSEPSSDDEGKHLESLRQYTMEYLLRKLSKEKSIYPTLTNVVIKFQHLQFHSKKPEPKFHVYWEGTAKFYFSKTDDGSNSIPLPKDATPSQIFDYMGREFDRNQWLKDVLVKVFEGGSKSPLSKAVQVQVRRLPKANEGGAVQLPPFYLGFGCTPPPAQTLSKDEKSKFTMFLEKQFTTLLKSEWLSTFQSIKLSISKVEINEKALKPDDKYNLYIQLNGHVAFSRRTPESTEIFRILTRCMDKQYAKDFIGGIWDLGGNIFSNVMRQAIRVCVWLDDDEEDDDELPAEEVENGDGEEVKNSEDGEEEKVDITQTDPDKYQKVHLEFNVALVVKELQELPPEGQLKELNAMMKVYFTKRLKKSYKETFVKFDTFDAPDPKYNTGRPLPRFNMIHQYIVKLIMKKPKLDEPKLDPMDILKKIIATKVLNLLNAIKLLSEPWNQTKEVTLGKGDYRKAPKDQIYGGTIDDDGNITTSKGMTIKSSSPAVSTKKAPAKAPKPAPAPPQKTPEPEPKEEDKPKKKIEEKEGDDDDGGKIPKFSGKQLPPPEDPEKETVELKLIPPKVTDVNEPSYPSRNVDEPEKSKDDEDEEPPAPVSDTEETEPQPEAEADQFDATMPESSEEPQPPTEEDDETKKVQSTGEITDEEDPARKLKFTYKQLPPEEAPEKEKVILKPIPPKVVETTEKSYITRTLDEPAKPNVVDDDDTPAPTPSEEAPKSQPEAEAPPKESVNGEVKPEVAVDAVANEESKSKYQRQSKQVDEEKEVRKYKITPGQGKAPPPKPTEKGFNPAEIVQWDKPEEELTELQKHMLKFKKKREQKMKQQQQ